jgi:hypothetical protein
METPIMNEAKPRFDPTVNLGHLLTFVGFIAATVAAWYGVKAEVESVKTAVQSSVLAVEFRVAATDRTVDRLVLNVEKLTAVTVITARQDEQILGLGRRLDAVERRPAGP